MAQTSNDDAVLSPQEERRLIASLKRALHRNPQSDELAQAKEALCQPPDMIQDFSIRDALADYLKLPSSKY